MEKDNMKLNTFKIEDYLGRYEFTAPYLLCCSDAESWSMQEVLELASADEQVLWKNLRLGYTEVKGSPQLRSTIATALYPGLSADNILCFSGAEEGIFCTLFSQCQPQDHVIVVTPCYQSLLEIPKAVGCSLTTVPLTEDQHWRLDLEKVKQAITPKTKWMIMNFPHNPTGQTISQQDLQDLIALLDPHGIWLFSDEVYRLMGPQSAVHAPPAICLYPRAISLGVMSKAFGMAGLRTGWVACQDSAMLQGIERTKHYTSICSSAPAEILSIIALRNKEAILQRNNAIVESNLTLLDTFFKDHSHLFSWVRPSAGCVGFVKYQSPELIDAFCQRLIEKAGVLLLPASVYDVSSNHFRMGFGRANMPEALERLGTFVHRNST